MTITFPITLPATAKPAHSVPSANSIVAMAKSPFTGQQQVLEYPGDWWEFEVTYPPQDRDDGDDLVSALMSLRGQRGTFYLGDSVFINHGARGTFTGTPLVKGAAQTGYSLITDGWTNGITIKNGNYIQLGSGETTRLHRIVKDVVVDGSGNAMLDIWPRLREVPGDNDPITITGCVGTFRLAGNRFPWDQRPTPLIGISFLAVEAR